MMKKFWMVYVDGERPLVFKHSDSAKARQEAERLARKLPGAPVYVLEAIDACKVADIQWTCLEEPF